LEVTGKVLIFVVEFNIEEILKTKFLFSQGKEVLMKVAQAPIPNKKK